MQLMKFTLRLFASSLLAAWLASCASSTMDSVPTTAELDSYEHVLRARFQSHYTELDKQRASGSISKAEYDERKRQLDSWVAEKVNEAAWQKHFLAESERKANGIPTPDAPVALNPGTAGGSMGSFYRPMNQNFSQAAGQSGSAGLGTVQAARAQYENAQTMRTSSGGAYLSTPPPGSVYDYDVKR